MGFLWDSPKQKLLKKENNELQRINSLIKGFKEENSTHPTKQLKNIIKSLEKQKKLIEQHLFIYQEIPPKSTQKQIDVFLESNKSILNHIANTTKKTLKKRISTPDSMKSHEAKFSSSSSRGSVRRRSRIINRSINPLDSPINYRSDSSSPYLPLESVDSYGSQDAKTIKRAFQSNGTRKKKMGIGFWNRFVGTKRQPEDRLKDFFDEENKLLKREEEKLKREEEEKRRMAPKFNLDNIGDDYFK